MKPKPQYHITGFNVVATGIDYRVDMVVAELPRPVEGSHFPTLELAKEHIAVTQKTLAQKAN